MSPKELLKKIASVAATAAALLASASLSGQGPTAEEVRQASTTIASPAQSMTPNQLVLTQSTASAADLRAAGHVSHASHASHASHCSHMSHYSCSV
jgi:hypothetical protein